MVYPGGLCFLLFHFQTRRVMCAKSWLYVLMFDRLFTVCRVWRQHKQNCIFHVHWCTWKILLTSLSDWNFLFSFFWGLGGVSTVMLLFTGMQVKETQWLVGQQEVDMTGTCCLSCRPNRLIQIFPPLSELYANIKSRIQSGEAEAVTSMDERLKEMHDSFKVCGWRYAGWMKSRKDGFS